MQALPVQIAKYLGICTMLSLAFFQLIGCSKNISTLALGTLERDRIQLKATANEIITLQPIAQGAAVKPGELIVQLDDRRELALVAKARANLASAQAYLSKLQNGARAEDIAANRAQVDGAQAQLLEAQKAFERAQTLVEQKLTSKAELDSARSKRDLAQANLKSAKENLLALTNGTRAEDLQQAEAQVELAAASLALEQQNLRELSIVATRAGVLDYLPKKLGDRSSPGETVAILLSEGAPYARVYIPSSQRLKLTAGQTLMIHVDGLNEPLAGTLRWISQDPAFTPYYALNSSDRARLVYLAEVDLPPSAANLPSGVPAQVELPSE